MSGQASYISAGAITPSSVFNTRIQTPIRPAQISYLNRMLNPPPPRDLSRPSAF